MLNNAVLTHFTLRRSRFVEVLVAQRVRGQETHSTSNDEQTTRKQQQPQKTKQKEIVVSTCNQMRVMMNTTQKSF
jgi:hypothetical protein